jgi:hypothetical protein
MNQKTFYSGMFLLALSVSVTSGIALADPSDSFSGQAVEEKPVESSHGSQDMDTACRNLQTTTTIPFTVDGTLYKFTISLEKGGNFNYSTDFEMTNGKEDKGRVDAHILGVTRIEHTEKVEPQSWYQWWYGLHTRTIKESRDPILGMKDPAKALSHLYHISELLLAVGENPKEESANGAAHQILDCVSKRVKAVAKETKMWARLNLMADGINLGRHNSGEGAQPGAMVHQKTN